MTKLSRREAFGAAALLMVGGGLVIEPTHDALDDEPEPDYSELAGILARWELGALRSKYPSWWRKVYYTSLCRFSNDVLIFFGVGRPHQVRADVARFTAFLADDDEDYPDTAPNLLATAVTPCGRAWVLLTRGRASDCCLDGLRRPSWKGRPLRRCQTSLGSGAGKGEDRDHANV